MVIVMVLVMVMVITDTVGKVDNAEVGGKPGVEQLLQQPAASLLPYTRAQFMTKLRRR